jgi:hypothetical protein
MTARWQWLTKLHIAVKGIFRAMFLKHVGGKTRRATAETQSSELIELFKAFVERELEKTAGDDRIFVASSRPT